MIGFRPAASDQDRAGRFDDVGSSARCGYEQGELAACQQLPEVTIETDEVFSQVDHCSGQLGGQPGVRQIVATQLFVQAELPKLGPLCAQSCQLHTGRCQQRIDKRHGIFNRRGLLEYLWAGDQPQEAGQHHRHQRECRARARLVDCLFEPGARDAEAAFARSRSCRPSSIKRVRLVRCCAANDLASASS